MIENQLIANKPNVAQRLRAFLRVPTSRRRVTPTRPRVLHVEAMEPRFLLSGEGLILPPPPPPQEAPLAAPIQIPAAQLASQVLPVQNLGTTGAQTPATSANEVIFVDPQVKDYSALVAAALQARPGQAAPARVEVVVLDANQDGVDQITAWLKGHHDLQAVHVLSHGDEAALRLGVTSLSQANLDDYREQFAAWGAALAPDADLLLYGCDVAAGQDGAAFVDRLAQLTGADVAASTDPTGAANLGGNWVLERNVGVIDTSALQASSYAALLALNTGTLPLNATLRTQFLSVLEKVDASASEALKTELINADLPGLGKSVNELIGLDTSADTTETITLFGLQAAASTYFAGGDASTLAGLANALQTAISTKTTAIATANTGQSWIVSVTPSFDPTASEVVAGLNFRIDLTDWAKAEPTFVDIASFTESGTLTSTSNVHFDLDAGLTVSGVNGATDAAGALASATSNNGGSWFRINHFAVSAALQNTDASKPFALEAGISTRLVDTNNSDHLNRVTLTDFAALTGATTAAKAANAIAPELVARIAGNDGSFGLFGVVTAGALTASTFTDVSLTGALATELKSVFDSAVTLTARIDSLSAMGITLPMADVSMAGLFTLGDGRSLGDVLAFRTPQNTSVLDDYLDDYLASGGTPTLSGLLARIQQYLSGTGAYDGLEAVLPAYAAAAFMDIRTTGYSGTQLKLDLNLKLSRQFLGRFTFNDKLIGLGFDWLPGEGVQLLGAIDYDTIWIADTAASESIEINTLAVQVSTANTALDAGIVLGALEGRAVGTVAFETSKVTIGINSGNAVLSGAVGTTSVAVSGTPTVKAAADFDIVGNIGGVDFKTLVDPTNLGVADSTSSELVITTTPTVEALTSTDTTPTITGTATLASGQTLVAIVDSVEYTVVSYDGSTYTPGTGASYNATTRAWSLNVPATLPLATYSVTARLLAPYSASTAVVVTGFAQTITGNLADARNLTVTFTGPATQTYTIGSGLSYDSGTGDWSLTIPLGGLTAGSYTQAVTALTPTGSAGTGNVAVVASLPARSYDATKPTANTLTTNNPRPVITGTSPLSTSDTLTVKLYSGASQVGSTYTVGDGYLAYDSATHVWTLTPASDLSAGTYSVTAEVQMRPHVGISFGTGNTSIDALSATNWSAVSTNTQTVAENNFDSLRKFVNLDSFSLSNMLTDLGTYLNMLRDSGQFDALLPYTNLTIGGALDFGAVMNELVRTQLVNVQGSGVVATTAISPVLATNTSFDIQFTRPGDSRTSVVTVTVLASETIGFTHINQLAQLIDQKVAASMGGVLAWTPGDGLVPASAQAEINELVQGGVALGSTRASSEMQSLLLHASSGTFSLQLGANGTRTGPISVLATTAEIQHALESLAEVGQGNVIVTGTPKRYTVEFIGDLAGRDLAALQVSFTPGATRGGVLDVVASGLELKDGKVWGRLALLENTPGTFATLRVAPSSGIQVSSMVTGATGINAVQRIMVVYPAYEAGTSFGLSLKVGTTTYNATVSLAPSTGPADTLSSRIQTALNTALGTAGSVTVSLVTDVAVMQGIQVFDVTFSGGSLVATDVALLTADATNMKSVQGVQSASFVTRESAQATDSTAVGEAQRMVIGNVTSGGQFSFGFTSNGKSYESDLITVDSADTVAMATAIRTALFALMRQIDSALNDPASVLVSDASSGGVYAFDISFASQLLGKDVAQIIVNPVALLPVETIAYGNLTLAGFSRGGQDSAQATVTTFNTLNDLMDRFQQAVNSHLAGAAFSVNPRYDIGTSSFLFDVKFQPTATVQATALTVPGTIGAVSGLSVDTTLDLTTQALFEGTVGFDFSKLNTFALNASGGYSGTVAGTVEVAAGNLIVASSGTALALTLGADSYTLSIPATDLAGGVYYTTATLLTAIQAQLNQAVTASGDLAKRGFTNLNQAVTASWKIVSGTPNRNFLQFATIASVDKFTVGANANLGFADAISSVPAPKLLALPSNGQLSTSATFTLSVDDSTSVSVTVTSGNTSGNGSVTDLLADINDALDAMLVGGHSYLGSGGLDFHDLGDIAHVYLSNGSLQFITLTPKVGSLKIGVASETNTATTVLGFTDGQKARTSGADVFLQNVTLGGDWSASVHDQTVSNSTTLLAPGSVSTGLLDLTFNQLGADYQGSYRFELRHNATETTATNTGRLSLNTDLFDAVSAQTSQLGMGGPLSTKSNQAVTGDPVQSNGQLLRDVGLKVTIAGAGTAGADLVLDVIVTQASTSGNNGINDLADVVDAAIHAAVWAAKSSSDPYATTRTTDATTTHVGTYGYAGVYKFDDTSVTPATTSYLLQFFAPTVGGSQANITVEERLLVANTMTPIVFGKNTGSASGPTASLSFGGLGITAPPSLLAAATVNPATTVMTVAVSNLTAVLAGAEATTNVSIVPSTGLGNLTPLTEITWGNLASDFAGLGKLFGTLDGLGPYGELGRVLPLLGSSVTDIFGLGDRMDAAQAVLESMDGTVIGSISAAASDAPLTATSVTANADFSLSFDNEDAYILTLTAASTTSNGTRADLVDDLQALLSTTDVVAGSALQKLGFRSLGQAVTVELDRTTDQIKFVVRAGVQNMQLSAATTSKFVTELGFLENVTVIPEAARVSLGTLQTVLASAFGGTTNDIALSYDSTGNALRIKLPYTVTLSEGVPLDVLLNDDFKSLLIPADRAKLEGLAGTITELTDANKTALLNLIGTLTFHFDLGIDLAGSGSNSNFGKLFLYDHLADASSTATLTDDTGTYATLALTASASNMAFDNSAGIMTLRVQGGSASVSANSSVLLDSGVKTSGAHTTADRVYLAAYSAMDAAATAADTTQTLRDTLDAYRTGSVDVIYTGTASASLPLTIVVSDDLGQLALEQLTGFVNPMPIGTMDLNFSDLGASYRAMAQQTLHLNLAMPSYDANVITVGYNGSISDVTIAARTATSGNVNDTQIKLALSESVAVLIKGARSGWAANVDYASMVDITGSRTQGFSIGLTGALANYYLSAGHTLSASVKESGSNAPHGSYSTPVISNSVVGIVLPNAASSVSFAYSGITTPIVVSVASSTASSGFISDPQIQAAFADAVATLLGGSASNVTVTGTRNTGFNVELTGTLATTHGNQLTVTVGAKTYNRAVESTGVPLSNGVYKAQTLEVRVGAGGTAVLINVAQSDARSGVVTDAEIRNALADAVYRAVMGVGAPNAAELAKVSVNGTRLSGFDIAVSGTVATTLGSDVLSITVKDTGLSLLDTASGGAVSGVDIGSTLSSSVYFSYGGKASQLVSVALPTASAGAASDAQIYTAFKNAVSTLLTGSVSSAANVTVTGTRAGGFTVTLTGTLATTYTGALTVNVYQNTTGATQGTYSRATSPTVVTSQVLEAMRPVVSTTPGNGGGDTGVEGAPLDNDNESALTVVNTNPSSTSSGGTGTTAASGASTTAAGSTTAPSTQPTVPSGTKVSYILPDIEIWQAQLLTVLQSATGLNCDPQKPESFPLIFLLRDPTILVESIDSVLGGIETSLDAVTSKLDLPIIGTQLQSALDFIVDLRKNVVGSLKTALESAIEVYGGLDNALRMYLFDVLTNDFNGDWSIDESDYFQTATNGDLLTNPSTGLYIARSSSSYNPYLNFIKDYNGDGSVTPDDIVVEYIISEAQDRENISIPAGMTLNFFDAGQRAAWVTSGMNTAIGALTDAANVTTTGATLTVQQPGYGDYALGFTFTTPDGEQQYQTTAISWDATASDIQAKLQLALDTANTAYVLANGATDLATTVSVVDGTATGEYTVTIALSNVV